MLKLKQNRHCDFVNYSFCYIALLIRDKIMEKVRYRQYPAVSNGYKSMNVQISSDWTRL